MRNQIHRFNRTGVPVLGITVIAVPVLFAVPTASALIPSAGNSDTAASEQIIVFEDVPLQWEPEAPDVIERSTYRLTKSARRAETTVMLPELPDDMRDARRITATLTVEPRLTEIEGGYRPGDPWTRLGTVSAVLPNPDPQPTEDDDDAYLEVELMRFITGYGGPGTFTANLTPYAPLLSGEATISVFISTYMSPGWDVSLTLEYDTEGIGFRRPTFAARVFNEDSVNAEEPLLNDTVTIPEGLDRPRIRVISTGHATDGRGGDEFIPRTHVLRINGHEIARWRPWAEDGGPLRPLNPMAGRVTVEGREVWSSDLDRSGWHPGLLVEPVIIPTPELVPGEHEIELEILGIRPADPNDPDDHHGFWRTSLSIVADEPWPRKPRQRSRDGEDAQR